MHPTARGGRLTARALHAEGSLRKEGPWDRLGEPEPEPERELDTVQLVFETGVNIGERCDNWEWRCVGIFPK